MQKKYVILILMVIVLIGGLQIPSMLESTYPLAPEDRTEAFYNVRYLLQGAFYLVSVVFVNVALLALFLKEK